MDMIDVMFKEYKKYIGLKKNAILKVDMLNKIRLDILNAALICLSETNLGENINIHEIDRILSMGEPYQSLFKRSLEDIQYNYIEYMTKFADDTIHEYNFPINNQSFKELPNFIKYTSVYYREHALGSLSAIEDISAYLSSADRDTLHLIKINRKFILRCIEHVCDKIGCIVSEAQHIIKIFIKYYLFANLYKEVSDINDIVNYKDIIPYRIKFNNMDDGLYGTFGIEKSFSKSIRNELRTFHYFKCSNIILWNYIADCHTLFDNIIVYSKTQRNASTYVDAYIYGDKISELLYYLKMNFTEFLKLNKYQIPENIKIDISTEKLESSLPKEKGNMIIYMHLFGNDADIQRILIDISNIIKFSYEMNIKSKSDVFVFKTN